MTPLVTMDIPLVWRCMSHEPWPSSATLLHECSLYTVSEGPTRTLKREKASFFFLFLPIILKHEYKQWVLPPYQSSIFIYSGNIYREVSMCEHRIRQSIQYKQNRKSPSVCGAWSSEQIFTQINVYSLACYSFPPQVEIQDGDQAHFIFGPQCPAQHLQKRMLSLLNGPFPG